MICPFDNCQTEQYRGENGKVIGDGFSSTDEYRTWTIQQCSKCQNLAIEFYCAKFLDHPNQRPHFEMIDTENL